MRPDRREPAAGEAKRPPAAWVHLTGYALVALAVYFGLRAMRPAGPAPPHIPARAAQATSAQVAAPPTEARRPSDPPERIDPPGGGDARAKLEPEVKAALEKHRKALVAACWEPVVGKAAASGKFSVRVMIDADGRELARSVRRDSGPDDVTVIECLGDSKRWPIKVSPPGERVGVVVAISFP